MGSTEVRYFALLLLVACCGCGARPAPTALVPLDEVSPELLKVAKKTVPQAKFDHARKLTFRGEEVLEIRGKLPNGKVREVKLTSDGKVVDVN
jgi:hypothetical protein